VYTCHVENSAGYEEAILTVYVAPAISVTPVDVNVTTTEHFQLGCCFRGFPVPSIQWYHNGSLVTHNETIMISIDYWIPEHQRLTRCSDIVDMHAEAADSGEYICRGINTAGDATSIPPALVLVQDSPEKPVITGAVNITSESAILQWMEPHNNNALLLGFYVFIDDYLLGNVTADEQSLNVTGLRPDTVYAFTLTAFNSIGESSPSDSLIFLTLEAAPSAPPSDVTAMVLSSMEILVSWDEVPSGEANGEITYYELEFYPLEFFEGGIVNGSVVTDHTSLVLDSLEEYVRYAISIRAVNGAGPGPYSDTLIMRTLDDAPSAAPASVAATPVSSSSIEVMWTELPEQHWNGNITYTVEYRPSSQLEFFYSTTATKVILSELEIFTEYSVRVSASTRVGNGPYSDFVSVTTHEDVPSASPTDLIVTNVTSTAIELMWGEAPEENQNGIITAYHLRLRQLTYTKYSEYYMVTVPAPNSTANLTGLIEYAEYFIEISASTAAGAGPFSDPVNVTTLEDVPAAPPSNVLVRMVNSTSLRVYWQALYYLDENGVITEYEVQYSSALPGTTSISVPVSKLTVLLTSLEEFTEYSIRVAAYTMVGAGPYSIPVVATTDQDVPSAAPETIDAVSTSQTSIQVAWDEVPEIDRNGIINGYEIEYWQSRNDSNRMSVTVGPNTFLHNLVTLDEFKTYVVRVRAYTEAGPGPYSGLREAEPTQNRTLHCQ
jgi:hypothetical protein